MRKEYKTYANLPSYEQLADDEVLVSCTALTNSHDLNWVSISGKCFDSYGDRDFLSEMKIHVAYFFEYAKIHPEKKFLIKDCIEFNHNFMLFHNANEYENVYLPQSFVDIFANIDDYGVRYSSDGKQLIRAYYQLEEYEIRDGVTEICGAAFAEQEKLKHIVIPEGVTKIGAKAFFRCYSLETISLPKSLEEVKYCAFGAFIKLKKISVPKDIHGKFEELERDYGRFFVERDE